MSKLPGPTVENVPGSRPAAGIIRPDIDYGSFGAGPPAVPETMKNTDMDVAFPTEGRRNRRRT